MPALDGDVLVEIFAHPRDGRIGLGALVGRHGDEVARRLAGIINRTGAALRHNASLAGFGRLL